MLKLKPFLLSSALMMSAAALAQNNIIPQPQKLQLHEGTFDLGKTIDIQIDKKVPELEYLAKQLASMTQTEIKNVKKKGDIFTSSIPQKAGAHEGYYQLTINDKGINIASPTNQGILYGIQTLLQIIEDHKDLKLPYLFIEDEPKFEYRGMHLDVGRHFFNVQEIKNYLDYLAAYKYNKFHWHLTEDQGWRIEIKKYPKLQSVAAWRNGTLVGPYSDRKFDDKKYGGYYTQEEVKEVVAYAKKLHIDVIPEIEMPGHAQAAIAAYPNLGCTDKPVEVWKDWGVSENIYCPKEETFKFLEDVLDEVIPLFPYEYIHIGGDEAPKTQWKESKVAQDLIKKLGLKDEHELQSYFITRMEKYINSKGKQIIGWDEILEGGLAPNATVMSWTGIEGGIHAAKTGHKAIMTPTSTNYFDYYQGNPETEPLAIGGDLRLNKVYSYNPIPEALNEEQAKYIWGTQGNLWTEYIPTFSKVQYMIFPRMMALSEVAWGTSKPSEYKNFENRVIKHFDILDRKGINYSRAIFEVEGKVLNNNGKLSYELNSANDPKNIKYTTDGSEPTVNSTSYSQPIPIDKTTVVKAAYFENGKKISGVTTQEFLMTKSTGKEISLQFPPSEAYSKGGANTLVDGIRGNVNNHGKAWLGFSGKDVVATIDFGAKTKFSNVKFTNVERQGSWIYLPKAAVISVSNDGKTFKEIKKISAQEIAQVKGNVDINLPTQDARYVKVEIQNLGKIPEGFPGAGGKAWLFVDEITVN
ncbi:glycoside hydrolase family 20 protein [Elizabethkingia sp. JS20170427COW]|uniref:glycoside hydrolase family 20 protein n=1 Tax=Elizabethkingia sp. JS20170427COW TaxID=2583851 RepID=UPI0011105A55|nr:glycoside hydrolase family 20 protein [Elizabethkingia sp. JS20170427COW]QCX54050.1 beta-N-acetylhexosaminidase [Elizabethkingia sp. JS20170427COW]